jgi:LemA protein
MAFRFLRQPEILFFLLLVAGIIALSLITIFNGIVSLRNQVDRAWSNIDVILKQRFDEIPALIRVLESSTHFEQAMISRILEVRTRYGSASNPEQKIRAHRDASVALKNVFAIGEAFPDLRSSADFLHLQKRLSELDTQIAGRREVYNEAVSNWNTKITTFPGILFRNRMSLEEKTLFPIVHPGGRS